jgi:hypothetical protein
MRNSLRATYGMEQELIDALARQHIGLDDPKLILAQRETIQVADLKGEAPSDILALGPFAFR